MFSHVLTGFNTHLSSARASQSQAKPSPMIASVAPAGITSGYSRLNSPTSHQRNLSLAATPDDQQPAPKINTPIQDIATNVEDAAPVDEQSDTATKPLLLTQEARDIATQHLNDLKKELSELKDSQINRFQQKREGDISQSKKTIEDLQQQIQLTQTWLQSISDAAQEKAPGFLKPNPLIDEKMQEAFQLAISSLADELPLVEGQKPSLFVVKGQNSKLWAMAEGAKDEAEVVASPRGQLHDIVVLDNLNILNNAEQIDRAVNSVKPEGFIVVVNAFNPDRGHINLCRHLVDGIEGQFQQPLSILMTERFKAKKMDVVQKTQSEGVETYILKRSPKLRDQLVNRASETVDQLFDSTKSFLSGLKSDKTENE